MKSISITLVVAAACSGAVSNAPKFPVTPAPQFSVRTLSEICGEDCVLSERETRPDDAALARRAQKALFAAFLSGTESRVCPAAELRFARGLIIVTNSPLCGELCDQPNIVEVDSFDATDSFPESWARISIKVIASLTVGNQDGASVSCGAGTDTSFEGFHHLVAIEQDGELVFIPISQGYTQAIRHHEHLALAR